MQVQDVIKMLEQLNPSDHVVIAWWEAGAFDDIKEEDWNKFADWADYELDWSADHEVISETYKAWQKKT